MTRDNGVRPLRMHSARHTFATRALESGRSLSFVSEQLGHASAAFTLQTYAHALPVEASDMSFADFGSTIPNDSSVAKRRYASPTSKANKRSDEVEDATTQNLWGNLERETGFEPATLSLGSFRLEIAECSLTV